MNDLSKQWRLQALTDLWTGDANRKGERTIPTGLLGSIRWWCEVLVRGLGGAACDPSPAGDPCPDRQGTRCVVCELFGCTGWGRKFRFEVRDGDGAVMSGQIKKDTEFILRFTPLRPIAAEEWALLDLTLRLIAEYGALGGKTVLKPSDEVALDGIDVPNDLIIGTLPRSYRGRFRTNDKIVQVGGKLVSSLADVERALSSLHVGDNVDAVVERSSHKTNLRVRIGKVHHIDYGLVLIVQRPAVDAFSNGRLQSFVCDSRWRKPLQKDFGWASLAHFWCVKGRHLARQNANQSTFNRVIGRPEPKSRAATGDSWLAGQRPDPGRNVDAASKKVFSFKQPARTFGFQRPGTVSFDTIKDRLQSAWSDFQDNEFLTGDVILARLTAHAGAAP